MEKNYLVEKEFRALGTDVSLKVVIEENDSRDAKGVLEEIEKLYLEKEKVFSRFDLESELSYFNKNIGKAIAASDDFIEVARKCLDFYIATQGYFDPRIIDALEKAGYQKDFKTTDFSSLNLAVDFLEIKSNLVDDLRIDGNEIIFNCRMDFSGIVKGFITDKARNILIKKGFTDFIVDSGGDMAISGSDQDGEKWGISIEGIAEDIFLINSGDCGIATSGISRRKWKNGEKKFHHLINPKKLGDFDFSLKSVTVVEKNVIEADVWAKVLFLKGKEDGLRYANEKNISGAFLDYRGNLFLSEKMKKLIEKND